MINNVDIIISDHKRKSDKIKKLNKKLKRAKSGMKESHIHKTELMTILERAIKSHREYYGQWDRPTDYEYGKEQGKAEILEDMVNQLKKYGEITYI